MALQNLLSQLRLKGLRSSSAIRSVHFCGVGTSLWKSTLLPPLMPPSTQLFHSLPGFPPITPSELGYSGRDLKYNQEIPASHGLYRDGRAVIRERPMHRICHKVLEGDDALKARAVSTVSGSLVCLALLQDCEASVVFSGTVVRSDGIVATSSACWRHLKGTEYEIGVKIMAWPHVKTYKGVLLHTDSVSQIAFVKILCGERLLRVPIGRKLEPRGPVVAASSTVFGNWIKATCGYSIGSYRSIDDDTENTESHIARTSGQLMEASCYIGKHGIGGALVSLYGGVLGVIHDARGSDIQATPIEDVWKYLKYFEKDWGTCYKGVEDECYTGYFNFPY